MEILLNQFIKYKVHIGHKRVNTNLLSSWFLYKVRNDIWLINLYKTIWILRLVRIFIKYLVTYNKPIWFINMDLSKQYIINQYANECGEFSCTAIWIKGLITNYFSMLLTVRKYKSKSFIYKDYKLYNFYNKWYLTRFTWARSIFISNLKNYNIICKEALSKFIPIIGLVDTNIKHHYFSFPIPCNDDSYDSLTYMCSIISKYILLNKYKKVLLWLNFYRYEGFYNDIIKFLERIKYIYIKINKLKKRKYYVFSKLDIYHVLKVGVNKLYNIKKEKNIYIESSSTIEMIIRRLEFYSDLINIGWYKKYIIHKNRIRMLKLHKVYYITNFFKLRWRYKMHYNYWFYFLYLMSYLRTYRIIVEMFMSNNVLKFFSILDFNNNYYFKKYKGYKDHWFTRRFKRYSEVNEYWYYLALKDSRRYTILHNVFQLQFYLLLFLKYLNHNKIKNFHENF